MKSYLVSLVFVIEEASVTGAFSLLPPSVQKSQIEVYHNFTHQFGRFVSIVSIPQSR